MAQAVAETDFTKLVFRAEPFSRMDSALRYELLSLSRPAQFEDSEAFYGKGLPPDEVFVLLSGKMRTLGDMPGTDGPILLGDHGPGACIGWDAALADVGATQAIAHGTASGIVIAAGDFIRIARQDPALRKSVLAQPTTGEIWRAVIAELRRRDLRVEEAASIVKRLTPSCIAREWPLKQAEIEAKKSFTWLISGGEDAESGARWHPSDDVTWARLIGIPSEKLDAAIHRTFGAASAQHSAATSAVVKDEISESPVEQPAVVKPAVPKTGGRRILKTGIVLLGLCAGAVIGILGWASRQPVVERIESGGRLFFAGDSHNLKASVSGRLSELRMTPGQRVEVGAVLAVVVPPADEAKTKLLRATLAQEKSEIAFCENMLADARVERADAPRAIAQTAHRIETLRSELRVKRAISSGGKDDPRLTASEKAVIDAHFAGISAERSARIDSAQNDSAVKREDLTEAEQALRDAQAELRLQISAAAEMRAERGEEAKLSAAGAARAIASYKRIVSQRQDAVNRIRKEIASIRVAPVSTVKPASTPESTVRLEDSIRDAEKEIREYLASVRARMTDTESGLEKLRADAAPRQITAARAGVVESVAPIPVGSEISASTVLGRFVTRSAWEIEMPEALSRFLKPGRQFAIFRKEADGTETRVDAYFTGVSEGAGLNRARFTTTASDEGWRHGDMFRVKTDAVVGSLLDRWMVDPSSIFR